MGIPVIIVDLRSKCILAKWITFSSSKVAGKEYTTRDTVEESYTQHWLHPDSSTHSLTCVSGKSCTATELVAEREYVFTNTI